MLHNTVAPRRVVCGLNQKHPTGEATRAAAAGDQENHSRSNISSNALPSRFELALVPTFTDEVRAKMRKEFGVMWFCATARGEIMIIELIHSLSL